MVAACSAAVCRAAWRHTANKVSVARDGRTEGISPDYLDADDNRPIFEWLDVIRRKGIVYVGLDALTDPSRSLPDCSPREDWQRHWRAAVEASLVPHRNLLVMSPWSLFRSGARADQPLTPNPKSGCDLDGCGRAALGSRMLELAAA